MCLFYSQTCSLYFNLNVYYKLSFASPVDRQVQYNEDVFSFQMAHCLDRYPIFENPYPLTIHESPVTCCEYIADCPAELIPALYSVGSRQKRQGYSKKVSYCRVIYV